MPIYSGINTNREKEMRFSIIFDRNKNARCNIARSILEKVPQMILHFFPLCLIPSPIDISYAKTPNTIRMYICVENRKENFILLFDSIIKERK